MKFRIPATKKLRLLPLVMTIFVCVSGGPFGLEEVMHSGIGMGLLLIIVTPLIWALPVALLTAELSSAIPEEGGYYIWVKRALGPAAGFFCAWLTYLYTWVDLAIYPVLFIGYLRSFPFASALANPFYAFLVSAAMILPLTWLNIRGVKSVGSASTLFTVLLIMPFLVIVVLGFHTLMLHPPHLLSQFTPRGQTAGQAFKTGLFVIMWNYMGWDSLSTIAGEVDKPQRTFPRAILLAMPMVVLIYFLPSLVGLVYQPDPAKWAEGSWPAIAKMIGGDWLATWLACCGLISACGLFAAGLLASSRIPMVLGRDKILPVFFTRLHSRYGTPWVAILCSALIYTAMSLIKFDRLAEYDVILYSSALVLEFAALLVLRIKEPGLARPFKIPGGWPVLIMVILLPISLISYMFYHMFFEKELWSLYILMAAFGSGVLIWLLKKKRS